MKRAREKAASEYEDLAERVVCGTGRIRYVDEYHGVTLANVIREQQLAFGRRVLEHLGFEDLPHRRIWWRGQPGEDDQIPYDELERLADAEGA